MPLQRYIYDDVSKPPASWRLGPRWLNVGSKCWFIESEADKLKYEVFECVVKAIKKDNKSDNNKSLVTVEVEGVTRKVDSSRVFTVRAAAVEEASIIGMFFRALQERAEKAVAQNVG